MSRLGDHIGREANTYGGTKARPLSPTIGQEEQEMKKITVTLRDIRTASVMSNDDCPVARALKRAGFKQVYVTGASFGYKAGRNFFEKSFSDDEKLSQNYNNLFGGSRKGFSFKVPTTRKEQNGQV
jgi:hypothetical protein